MVSKWPPDQRLALRLARLDDLDNITTIAQRGFPDDPEFDYRFPYRDEFPEDNRRWICQEYREYLEQPEKYIVIIITASDNDDKAVALSIWDVSPSTPQKGSGLGIPDDPREEPQRKDANPAHFRQFKKDMDAAFTKYFAQYGNQQIHLWLLCTHPSFRRRGAGTRLCEWGLDQAKQRAVPATVLASPMGNRLYEEVGFTSDGSFLIGDEPEKFTYWALTHRKMEPAGLWHWLKSFIVAS